MERVSLEPYRVYVKGKLMKENKGDTFNLPLYGIKKENIIKVLGGEEYSFPITLPSDLDTIRRFCFDCDIIPKKDSALAMGMEQIFYSFYMDDDFGNMLLHKTVKRENAPEDWLPYFGDSEQEVRVFKLICRKLDIYLEKYNAEYLQDKLSKIVELKKSLEEAHTMILSCKVEDILTMNDSPSFKSCFDIGHGCELVTQTALTFPNFLIAYVPFKNYKKILGDINLKKFRVIFWFNEDLSSFIVGESKPDYALDFREQAIEKVCELFNISDTITGWAETYDMDINIHLYTGLVSSSDEIIQMIEEEGETFEVLNNTRVYGTGTNFHIYYDEDVPTWMITIHKEESEDVV